MVVKLGANTTLSKVLWDMFVSVILDPPSDPPEIKRRLIISLQRFPSSHISDPPLIMNFAKGLHSLNKGISSFFLLLFFFFLLLRLPLKLTFSMDERTNAHIKYAEYAAYNPDLFSLYIPCVVPSKGVELDAREAQECLRLLASRGFSRESNPKRKYHEMLNN